MESDVTCAKTSFGLGGSAAWAVLMSPTGTGTESGGYCRRVAAGEE
jgi:hypothetical protein